MPNITTTIPSRKTQFKSIFQSGATYLITGGLGGFGLATARWAVQKGARHLVLVGRRGITSEATRLAVEELKQLGAEIQIAQIDVTQEAAVVTLIENIQTTMPPLRGVIHAAMVLDDTTLLSLTPDRLEQVTAPKVKGAWNLHTHTLSLPLDFFVLFSSLASVIGNPGQSNYVAANSFLDALSYHRQALNLPALTVNWGVLSDAGFFVRKQQNEIIDNLERVGWLKLSVQQALETLERLLEQSVSQKSVAQITVGGMNWNRWGYTYGSGTSTRFAQLVSNKNNSSIAVKDEKNTTLLENLQANPPEVSLQCLKKYLHQQVATVLGIASEKIEIQRSLTSLGLDSLTAMELRNCFRKDLAIDVPTMKFMQGINMTQLCFEIALQLNLPVSASTTKLEEHYPAAINEQQKKWFVCFKPNPQAQLRLFCFPYNGGSISTFHNWVDQLPPEIEVWAVQIPGQLDRQEDIPIIEIQSLLEEITPHLLAYLDKPFAFYGHSLGALLSFALTHHLRQYKFSPIHLFVGAYHAPYLPDPFMPYGQLKDDTIDNYSANLNLLEVLGFADSMEPFLVDREFIKTMVAILKSGDLLQKSYYCKKTPVLDCPITVFGGEKDRIVTKALLAAWRKLTRQSFQLQMLPGGHLFLHSDRDLLLPLLSDALKQHLIVVKGEKARHFFRKKETSTLHPYISTL